MRIDKPRIIMAGKRGRARTTKPTKTRTIARQVASKPVQKENLNVLIADRPTSNRKRRSTNTGPAPKRQSGEKCDDPEFQADSEMITSGGRMQTRRRSQPMPIMEEDEVFLADASMEIYSGDESDDSDEDSLQNRNFIALAIQLDAEPSTPIKVPPQLTDKQCEGIGSPAKIWNLMLNRDVIPRATRCLFQQHPQMNVNNRAILIEWMMEVCNQEAQHRETFHLAVDYVDRYLEAAPREVTLLNFQLLGTTALFIASKYEEIYPPKCSDFVAYTDDTFNVEQVRQMEVLLVNCLDWTMGPTTSVHWLATYLQLLGKKELQSELTGDTHTSTASMSVPELMREDYTHMAKILDLLLLDVDSLCYTYRTIAAAVLFVCYEPHRLVEQVTGISYDRMQSAIEFVEPFVSVMDARRLPGDPIEQFHKVPAEEAHMIQSKFPFKNFNEGMKMIKEEVDRHKKTIRINRGGSSTPVRP